MTNKEEFKQIFRQLRTQGDVALVREKTAEFLKNVDPKTLSLAEQEIMQRE